MFLRNAGFYFVKDLKEQSFGTVVQLLQRLQAEK